MLRARGIIYSEGKLAFSEARGLTIVLLYSYCNSSTNPL